MNNERDLRNEEILLIGLCRLEFSDELLKKIRALISVVKDWEYFAAMANTHGVAALIWHNITGNRLNTEIPEDITAVLRGALMKNLGRNTFFTEALQEVLRLFNSAKIKTVLLKGMALENSVYGNAGLRQMSDLDILVASDECMKAWQLLIRNGYVSLPVKSFFHKYILIYTGKHLPSVIKNGASVEIHHELFGEKLLTRKLFETSYTIGIKGEKACLPQPQIFFLYLVKHLWLHEMNNESQLRLYTDLVVLIEKHRDEILNNDLIDLASQAGIPDILAWHLEMLRGFWGIVFPEWIDDFIDQQHNESFKNKFVFFLRSPKDNPPPDNSLSYRDTVSDIPGLHRKILFLLGDLFPSLTFMKKRYNCHSTWKVLLYYPQRFGKLLWLFKGRTG